MKGLVDLLKKRKNTARWNGNLQQERYPIDENERTQFRNGRGGRREKKRGAERGEVSMSVPMSASVSASVSSENEKMRRRRQNYQRKNYHDYDRSEDDIEENDKQRYSSPLQSSPSSSSSSYISSSFSSSSTSTPSYSSYSLHEKKQQYKKDLNRRKRDKKKIYKFSREKKKRTLGNYNRLNELLTREELFEFPARDLRKKCRILGLDASRVVEKEGLVLLIHDFYRRQSNEGKTQHHDPLFGNTITNSPPLRNTLHTVSAPSNNTNTSNNLQVQTSPNPLSPNFPLLNDENEQMVEILFEIIPYYGQGDPSIDSIIKDTIQRLPIYCLERREQEAGNTLMMISCQTSAIDLISMLLSKGSDFNAQNRYGETGLHFVCYNDSYSPEIAQMLVNHGAKAEVPEKRFGCTPLHWAASAGDVNLCRILCSSGARVTTVDKSGFDPIAYSKQSQKQDCVNFLMSKSSSMKEQKETEGKSLRAATNKDDLGWGKLLDDSTGYIYFHNWKTGQSMWEDDYIIHQRSITNGGLKPISSSFTNRPPPPSPGFKSFSTSKQSLHDEEKEPTLDTRAQGKEFTEIKHFDYADDKEQKEEGVKTLKTKFPSIGNISSTDLKAVLSDSDVSSSHNSSMIDYEEVESEKSEIDRIDIIENSTHAQNECPPTQKMVTQGSFNQRLTSLQSRMEEQLNQQLEQMEKKITVKRDDNEAKEESADLNKIVSELTSKVVKLQAEIGTKELELSSLRRHIITLETNTKCLEKTTTKQDAFVGDDDIRENTWVHIDDVNNLKVDITENEKQLLTYHEEIINLKSLVNGKTREIESLVKNQVRGKEQVAQIEGVLKQEKEAKNEVILLLEQTRRGAEVDAEVSKSFEDEKRRGEEELSRLKDQLKEVECRAIEEIKMHNIALEKTQRVFLCEQSEVKSLRESNQKQKDLFEEKEIKTRHKHLVEIDDIRVSMQSNFDKKLSMIENELKEEKIARAQIELERDEAIQRYENSLKQIKEAELQTDRMSTMIEEAKAMVGKNEILHRSLHLEIDKRKALHNHLEDLRGKIRVYVRIRPLSSREIKKNCKEALVKEDKRTCVMHLNGNNKSINNLKNWEFDTVFQGSSSNGNDQEDVFRDTKRLVTSTIDGFNVCILAYGQTGGGKTYTIWGDGKGGEISHKDSSSLDADLGLAPRMACELFRLVEERKSSFDVEVKMNMFELYNDNVRDLMASSQKNKNNNDALRIKLAEHSESGLVEVSGAVTQEVENASQLLELFKKGSEFRTTASTKMNADSSRSHLITCITVSLTNKRTEHITNGKMTLVDLAGSERVGKSGATGSQLKEAQSINKSLSALGDVINALTSGSKHIPYRNHPLTMLMSDSMGGNAKTLMFVCCSPADYNSSETCNALDFAKRCKDITNNVTGSTGGELGQVKALKAELSRLKKAKGVSMARKMGVPTRPGRR